MASGSLQEVFRLLCQAQGCPSPRRFVAILQHTEASSLVQCGLEPGRTMRKRKDKRSSTREDDDGEQEQGITKTSKLNARRTRGKRDHPQEDLGLPMACHDVWACCALKVIASVSILEKCPYTWRSKFGRTLALAQMMRTNTQEEG